MLRKHNSIRKSNIDQNFLFEKRNYHISFFNVPPLVRKKIPINVISKPLL